MTTLKRIVAVLLAVMLIASIGSIAASATGHELEIKLANESSKDFYYTVYKIADLVKADGKIKDGSYSCTNDAIKAIVESDAANTSGASFRNALDNLYTTNPAAFGTPIQKDGSADKVSYCHSVKVSDEGIYYARLVSKEDKPATYTKAQNVVIVWPEYKKPTSDSTEKEWIYAASVALDGKVASGTDHFDKYFTNMTADGKITVDKDPKFKGLGDTVKYTLEGTITGSAAEHLQKFEFTDTMCPGLDYTDGSMKVYYGKDDTVILGTDLLKTGKFTMTKTGTTVFTISATDGLLADDNFYDKNAHNKIYVQFEATVNKDAVIGKAGNPNTGKLSYTNASGLTRDLGPMTVYVFTFKVTAKKLNASNNAALAGAKFQIGKGKDGNGNLTDVFAYGISDADGNITFTATDAAYNESTNPAYRFAPNTYYCKETYVPDGFALSSKVYTVNVPAVVSDPLNAAESAFNIKVQGEGADGAILNYPVKLPETGGAGTMMFTIIGGCLVLAAGVMFVIIMKKRASSK